MSITCLSVWLPHMVTGGLEEYTRSVPHLQHPVMAQVQAADMRRRGEHDPPEGRSALAPSEARRGGKERGERGHVAPNSVRRSLRPRLVSLACGCSRGAPQPYWYPATTDCNKIVDYNAAVWVYGGCYYDLPVGACSSKAVNPTSQGCAAAFEQHMASKVRLG